MKSCSFDRLVRLLDKQLDLEGKLEVFDHLDRCENCRDTVYQIARDRDRRFFIPRTHKPRKAAVA